MVTITPHCPHCGSDALVRDGHAPNGKQKYRCHACGRRSRENPTPVSPSLSFRPGSPSQVSHYPFLHLKGVNFAVVRHGTSSTTSQGTHRKSKKLNHILTP